MQKTSNDFEDDDVERLINKGFESYINIVQTSFYDKVAPYVLSFILSLSPQQSQYLQKC
jgi:hypothetical protein